MSGTHDAHGASAGRNPANSHYISFELASVGRPAAAGFYRDVKRSCRSVFTLNNSVAGADRRSPSTGARFWRLRCRRGAQASRCFVLPRHGAHFDKPRSYGRRHWRLYRGPNKKKENVMLPTVIYLIHSVRRALKKTGRGLFILAETLNEALDQSRAARRKYPAAE
jgi:hypothetical protein